MATIDHHSFNINDYVRVKLTFIGWALLNGKNRIVSEDTEGWSRWQLWDLMNTFGTSLYNGCDVPFETNIRIEVSNTLPERDKQIHPGRKTNEKK